jgi:hypothetical protein
MRLPVVFSVLTLRATEGLYRQVSQGGVAEWCKMWRVSGTGRL